jgi:hypothetical protein
MARPLSSQATASPSMMHERERSRAKDLKPPATIEIRRFLTRKPIELSGVNITFHRIPNRPIQQCGDVRRIDPSFAEALRNQENGSVLRLRNLLLALDLDIEARTIGRVCLTLFARLFPKFQVGIPGRGTIR